MSRLRRVLTVLTATGLSLACGWALIPASAQQQKQAMPVQIQMGRVRGDGTSNPVGNSNSDSVTLPSDRKARRSIEVAEDFIKQELWGDASRILQTLLDTKEDVFVEVTRNGTVHWMSLRREANRLIGEMPAQGRQFYELQFGARAKARLTEAKNQSDPKILAEVAQRYMHTEAGAEASNLLGTYHLDRGNVVQAALCFERVLAQERPEKLAPITFVKACLAFQRIRNHEKAEQTWKLLTRLASRDGVRVGGRNVRLDQLKDEIDRYGTLLQSANPYDWSVYRGNPNRSGMGNGSAPFLQAEWSYPTSVTKRTADWLDEAMKPRIERTPPDPVIASFFPIAATVRTEKGTLPLLLYRGHGGVHARNLGTPDGKLEWKSTGNGGLDNLVSDPAKELLLTNWLKTYTPANANLLYENSTIGTLSTDNQFVYIVEDLAIPPHPVHTQSAAWGQQQPGFGALSDQVYHNRLEAFDLWTGKAVWSLGGRATDKDEATDAGKLSDCYFLGPPLPLGDKLYVLADKNSELRLICLDKSREEKPQPTIAWMQTLGNVRDKLLIDVRRRMQAAHLSYGDGILVCPTNAGVILGIDVLAQSFAWAHSYREDSPSAERADQPAFNRRQLAALANGQPTAMAFDRGWKTSAPVIQDGKVVFTAPDADSVHCLDLRTGELVWKQSRDVDDMYLAGVYHGKVLIVGRTFCRAFNLADGKLAWRTDTGVPSGQGVASEETYYLPLRSGVESGLPEVCALDILTGRIVGSTVARKDEVTGKVAEVPGNLLFYEGDVISQTADRITVYRQLRVRLQEIDIALQKNPKDPTGLCKRGEMRLEKGDLAGAVDDLRTALANDPPPDVLQKTRTKLFETYTKFIQRDFNAGEKYLKDYEAMCEVAALADATPEKVREADEERRRRRGNFLSLVAKGREEQGRLTEAFQAYMDFAAHAAHNKLVAGLDEPTVKARPDVWAQARIAAMVHRAGPDQRQPLETLIRTRWEGVKTKGDLQELRGFVGIFGSVVRVGNEARLLLAERLMEENAFLEAELHLLQLHRQSDQHLAALAVEALARLMMKKELFEDAAYWYRILGEEFAQVKVREDKTGTDFLNDLATDKRLLPYIEPPTQPWAKGPIKAKEVHGSFSGFVSQTFEPDGEIVPFFDRHRLLLQHHTQLRLVDRMNNQERYTQPVSGDGSMMQLYANASPNTRLPFQTQGHLIVVNVGDTVYAIDAVERKKLWEHNLFGGTASNQPRQVLADGDGVMRVIYPDGYSRRLGRVGAVEPSYVCLLTRDGLLTLDPIHGTILWSRNDIPTTTEVFGDEKFIYLVNVSNGNATAGRALRARDGASVNVPDFASVYQHRLRVLGGRLLASERKHGERILRLYDIQSGKNVWERSFGSSALVLQTEESDLVAVVTSPAEAKVTILNVHAKDESVSAQLDPKDLEKIDKVHLLADANLFYIVCNRAQGAPGPVMGGMAFPNVMGGLRCLPVNGMVYAIERQSGKIHWKKEVLDQMLVLDQYKDIPMLLFTACQQRAMAGGGFNLRGNAPTASTQSIEKRTGKLLFDGTSRGDNQFFSLVANVQAGTIEMIGNRLKIIHYLEGGVGPQVSGAMPSPPDLLPRQPRIPRAPQPADKR